MSYCKDPRDSKYKRTTRMYYQFSSEIPQHPMHFAFGAYPVELNEASSQFLIKTRFKSLIVNAEPHCIPSASGAFPNSHAYLLGSQLSNIPSIELCAYKYDMREIPPPSIHVLTANSSILGTHTLILDPQI